MGILAINAPHFLYNAAWFIGKTTTFLACVLGFFSNLSQNFSTVLEAKNKAGRSTADASRIVSSSIKHYLQFKAIVLSL